MAAIKYNSLGACHRLCVAAGLASVAAGTFVHPASAHDSYAVAITVTMKGRFTQEPTSPAEYCNTAAGAAGIFLVWNFDDSTCIDLDEEIIPTSCGPSVKAEFSANCDLSDAFGDSLADGSRITYSSDVFGQYPFVKQYSDTVFGHCWDKVNVDCSIVGSWAAASADVSLTSVTAPIEYLCELTFEIHRGVSTHPRLVTGTEKPKRFCIKYSSPDGEVTYYGTLTHDQVTIEGLSPTSYTTPSGTSTVVTFEAGTGTVSPGSASFETSTVCAEDVAFDLNADGVFDAGDVQWVRDNYRTIDVNTEIASAVPGNFVVTWPATTPTEAINSDDADYLQDILDRLGPTLRFGDFNRDGMVDCKDAWGSTPYFGTSVGDPDYRYALDADADGVVDENDKEAFFALVNHCDFNHDELVDDGDHVIFVSAYNILDCEDPLMPAYCPADLNLDGYVDDADYVIFLARYNNLLC